jgi:hypothetical protein
VVGLGGVRLRDARSDRVHIERAPHDRFERAGLLAEKRRTPDRRERMAHGDEGLEHGPTRAAVVGEPDLPDRSMPRADPLAAEVVGQSSALREGAEERSHVTIHEAARVARDERRRAVEPEENVQGAGSDADEGASGDTSQPHRPLWKPVMPLEGAGNRRLGRDRGDGQLRVSTEWAIERAAA